jgi:hypothetical protein
MSDFFEIFRHRHRHLSNAVAATITFKPRRKHNMSTIDEPITTVSEPSGIAFVGTIVFTPPASGAFVAPAIQDCSFVDGTTDIAFGASFSAGPNDGAGNPTILFNVGSIPPGSVETPVITIVTGSGKIVLPLSITATAPPRQLSNAIGATISFAPVSS